MTLITIALTCLAGLALGVLIGYFLPTRRKKPRDLLLESESKDLSALSEIKEQLLSLDRYATVGYFKTDFPFKRESHTKTNAKDAVQALIAEVKMKVDEKQITIKTEMEKSLMYTKVPLNILRHIILVVIINATEALDRGGEIQVRLKKKGTNVNLSVEDNGVGMSDKVVARLFEPFYTTKKEGAGLGLYAAKELASRYGGKLFLKSTKGGGTTVDVTMPLISNKA